MQRVNISSFELISSGHLYFFLRSIPFRDLDAGNFNRKSSLHLEVNLPMPLKFVKIAIEKFDNCIVKGDFIWLSWHILYDLVYVVILWCEEPVFSRSEKGFQAALLLRKRQ